ncbi:MAG: hypothetical protein HQK50_11045 [Oligoflexia bacterium]|nr:hypothetical protein [Oligoflexia bacterium]MBF0366099.1 hypothetical protein [Oligoflexia bacterium]
MRTLSTLFLALLLYSCSSYQPPESMDARMARTNAVETAKAVVPDIPIGNIGGSGRSPASAGDFAKTTDEQKKKRSNLFREYSSKKLYFLTLVDQYEQFRVYVEGLRSSQTPIVDFCPQFHTVYLQYYAMYDSQRVAVLRKDKDRKIASMTEPILASYPLNDNLGRGDSGHLFPELFLPLSEESAHPNVMEFMKNFHQGGDDKKLAIFMEAFRMHLARVKKEISEMCEYGSGQNYYVFENLMTYVKNNQGFRNSKEAMVALLKTTILSNHAILAAMDAEFLEKQQNHKLLLSINSTPLRHELRQEVFDRLDAQWALAYFSELKRIRGLASSSAK